jgi:hypothetical protein
LDAAAFAGILLRRRRGRQQRFGGAETSGGFGALGHGFPADFRKIVD